MACYPGTFAATTCLKEPLADALRDKPALHRWLEAVGGRPAVQRGMAGGGGLIGRRGGCAPLRVGLCCARPGMTEVAPLLRGLAERGLRLGERRGRRGCGRCSVLA